MEGESPSLNRALSNCLKLQYINFFGSNFSNFNFENSVYHMMMITQTSCLHKWKFRFAISKYMHEPPCKILTDLSNTRENIYFPGMEPCKLIQPTIFLFWGFFKRYNLYIRWNFKIIKPSWRYVWFNKYHQATFFVYNFQSIW